MNDNRRMPAEWEAQQAILIALPHKDSDWRDILDEVTDTYVHLVNAIATHERVVVIGKSECRTSFMDKVRGNVEWIDCDTNDTWTRDYGFITVHTDTGTKLLDFKFNAWGEKFECKLDNAVNKRLYDLKTFEGTYESNLDFVLEGGSIESDGCGTIFTTTSCLLAPHRNQPLTKDEIEEQLKRRLGAKRIVWINHGHVEGDDTDGHIDTMVRIAPNDTLLYIGGDKELEDELRQLRTLDGRPYRLRRLPEPRPIMVGGERLPATYANYLVTNNAVIVPTYGQEDNDNEAARIIGETFSGREIVTVDSRTLIRQHGSIHCSTMQLQ